MSAFIDSNIALNPKRHLRSLPTTYTNHRCTPDVTRCTFFHRPDISADLFICEVSGNLHVCGVNQCDFLTCPEDQFICALTGNVARDGNQIYTAWHDGRCYGGEMGGYCFDRRARMTRKRKAVVKAERLAEADATTARENLMKPATEIPTPLPSEGKKQIKIQRAKRARKEKAAETKARTVEDKALATIDQLFGRKVAKRKPKSNLFSKRNFTHEEQLAHAISIFTHALRSDPSSSAGAASAERRHATGVFSRLCASLWALLQESSYCKGDTSDSPNTYPYHCAVVLWLAAAVPLGFPPYVPPCEWLSGRLPPQKDAHLVLGIKNGTKMHRAFREFKDACSSVTATARDVYLRHHKFKF